MITIIDYGAGNIRSIQNMLKRIGVQSIISSEASVIADADKLILPGVGHFDHGMRNLKNSGLIDVMNEKVVKEEVPFLGICLGAQLLGNGSEEGTEDGLGWIPMNVVAFDRSRLSNELKVPHMGWNTIEINSAQPNVLFKDLEGQPKFYFVHSFHMQPIDDELVLSTSNYGYDFTSAVQFKNVFGVQFHPEKSHAFGMNLLKNFASYK